jgi:hypothetical protein
MPDTTLTSAELDELEQLAKAATPGPWDVWAEPTKSKDEAIDELAYQVINTPDEDFAEAVYLLNANGKCPATTGCGPTSKANAAYIASANPATILRLLSLARAGLEAGKDEESMREALAPFAAVAEADIGDSETDEDRFVPMSFQTARAPQITVGDMRRAATAIRALPLTGDKR